MKRFNLLFTLVTSIALFFISCDKDDNDDNLLPPVTHQAKMDELINLIENKDRGMGFISIFDNGKEVYRKGYGYTDIEKKLKPNQNTKYRIGSISKTFTATIILKLLEEKKLSLNDKLSKYYPEIQNSDNITIEHMLRHQSGIGNLTEMPDYLQWNHLPQTKVQLLEKIKTCGIIFEAGKSNTYSNSNFILLTYIAEDASSKSFSDLLKDYILTPCGLKNTKIYEKINSNNNEAYSYSKKLGVWALDKETDASIPLGAGFIASTSFDLNIFFNDLLNGKIINAESLKLMTEVKKVTEDDFFGLGIISSNIGGLSAFGHSGGIDGFRSFAAYIPSNKISIAITSNASHYDVMNIVEGALNIYLGKNYNLPEFKEPLKLTSEDLDKYVGSYTCPTFYNLTIKKMNTTLLVKIENNPELELECYEPDIFVNEYIGLIMSFKPSENKMTLQYNKQDYMYTKE